MGKVYLSFDLNSYKKNEVHNFAIHCSWTHSSVLIQIVCSALIDWNLVIPDLFVKDSETKKSICMAKENL